MEIKKVAFGRTINAGNYESLRYDLTAEISPDDNIFEVLNHLSELIEISHKEPKLSHELYQLEQRQKTARSEARELEREVEKLAKEVKALQQERDKLRESFSVFLEDSIPSENKAANETAEGGDPDDIPFDSTNT